MITANQMLCLLKCKLQIQLNENQIGLYTHLDVPKDYTVEANFRIGFVKNQTFLFFSSYHHIFKKDDKIFHGRHSICRKIDLDSCITNGDLLIGINVLNLKISTENSTFQMSKEQVPQAPLEMKLHIYVNEKPFEQQLKELDIDHSGLQSLRELNEQVVSLQKRISDRIREEEKCKICMENKINTLLIPCGHLAFCEQCSKKIKTCPFCKGPITSFHKVFI